MLAPDVARAGEADLVDEALVERAARARRTSAAPSASTRLSTPVGQPAVQEQLRQRVAERGRVLGRLPHDRVAAQQRRARGTSDGTATGKLPGGDDRRHADRHAEREQLLVGHLARHRLAVEAPALAEEEVARVDDLLHLAERLGVGLADLARDEPGERLLVVLDEPADLLDRAAADRRGDRGPRAPARRARRGRRRRTCRRRRAATSATTSSRCRPGWSTCTTAAGRVGARRGRRRSRRRCG